MIKERNFNRLQTLEDKKHKLMLNNQQQLMNILLLTMVIKINHKIHKQRKLPKVKW